MKNFKLFAIISGLLWLMIALAPPLGASPITWTIGSTQVDNDTPPDYLTGTFVYDATTQTFSNIDLQITNVFDSPQWFAPSFDPQFDGSDVTYASSTELQLTEESTSTLNPGEPSVCQPDCFTDVLTLNFDAPLTDAGGTVTIDPSSTLAAYYGSTWPGGFSGHNPGDLVSFSGSTPDPGMVPIDGLGASVSAPGGMSGVPEPGSLVLIGSGLLGLGSLRRRRGPAPKRPAGGSRLSVWIRRIAAK